jgi:hypothetical protein
MYANTNELQAKMAAAGQIGGASALSQHDSVAKMPERDRPPP